MAETVEVRSNGDTTAGYLVTPPSGSGPGVVVVQEWWGVDPALKVMAGRLAEGGFVALVPDLFRGELAGHDEMDKAAQGDSEPDWSALSAAVQGHMAEKDDFFPPDKARALEQKLRDLGKDVNLRIHPGAGHGFMNPDNPIGNLDEELAARIWPEVLAFLHSHLN